MTILMGTAPVGWVRARLFMQTLFVAAFFPTGFVCIAKMFDRETRGMATGSILTFAVVGGVAVVPYLLGLASDHVSFRFGIVTIGILVCLSSFLIVSLKELNASCMPS